jgi:hypothetical protein
MPLPAPHSTSRPAVLEALEDRRLLATVTLNFDAPAGGVAGTGFSAVLPTSSGRGLVAGNLGLSGGRLNYRTTGGDLTRNNQDNALVRAMDGSKNFTAQTRLTRLPFGANWQNAGLLVGTSQDNYVKVVAGYAGGTSVQLASESAAKFSTAAVRGLSFGGVTSLDLKLIGNAATKTITAQYRVNSTSETAWVTAGSIPAAAVFSTGAKVGLVGTNFGAGAITPAFDSFTFTDGATVLTPPSPITPSGTAPLRASADGHYLVTADGKPFTFVADTAWYIHDRLTRESADRYLQARAGQGFTVIQSLLTYSLGTNAYGQTALIGNDPSRPNEAYFRHVDYIIAKTNALGMIPAMGVIDGRSFRNGWFTEATAYAMGRYLGNRYKGQRLIWMLGADTDPTLAPSGLAVTRAFAKGITETYGGGRHENVTMTFFPSYNTSSSKWFQNDPWLDFDFVHSGHAVRDNYNLIAADYRHATRKPTFDGEAIYESIPFGLKSGNPRATDYHVRIARYWSLFAGAFGVSYGHRDVYQFYVRGGETDDGDPRNNWFDVLNSAGANQMRHVRRLIESRPFLSRVPDQSLIAGTNPTNISHLQATRDASGSYAWVYSPDGRAFTVHTSKLSGSTLVATWYNPRTGQSTAAGRFAKAATRTFTPPTSGTNNDWVLILDDASKGYRVP